MSQTARFHQALVLCTALAFVLASGACTSMDADEGSWNDQGTTNSPTVPANSGAAGSSGTSNAGPFVGADAGAPLGSGGFSGTGGVPGTGGGAVAAVLPTNPFVNVAHDPFSTFATDVDTASYDIFRRDVNLGRLPQASQVRLEEFVNSFAYEYAAPAPTSEVPFAIGIKAAVSPFASGTTLVRVNVQGKSAAAAEKKPANIVYLIDVSGSMASDDKLPLVKQVARASLDVLSPTDKVSIVTYSGSTELKLSAVPASEKTRIRAVIDGLRAAGSTAGGSGITLAYEAAAAGFIPGGINHVIMCTDGDFNVGISSTDALVRLIEEKRKTGITLTALGFGSDNLNDLMMERVSNAGNGVYAVISNEGQAATYVRDSLLSTIVHIAKDVKIQVEFNPARVVAYRLLGYEDRAIADTNFRNDAIDAGEIGAGHRVTALYEVVLVGGVVPMPVGAPAVQTGAPVAGARETLATDLAMVKVRYKLPGATESDAAREVNGHLSGDEVVQTLAAADADTQWAAAVAAFAEVLKGSPFANRGNLGTIAAVVEAQKSRDEGRGEFAVLFAKAVKLLGQ